MFYLFKFSFNIILHIKQSYPKWSLSSGFQLKLCMHFQYFITTRNSHPAHLTRWNVSYQINVPAALLPANRYHSSHRGGDCEFQFWTRCCKEILPASAKKESLVKNTKNEAPYCVYLSFSVLDAKHYSQTSSMKVLP